ncbi:MAG: glycosyltransferase family 2 protein [Candidatus Limnocylindria bacterium]
MKIRLGALALLFGSAGLGWRAGSSPRVGRVVRLWTAASLAYTAVLAWRGGDAMRAARRAVGPRAPSWRTGERPFVTLMVPARDEAAVIADVVRDLGGQRYARDGRPNFEVIVIDDGSTDGTADLARKAAHGALGPVRVVQRPNGTGPALRGAALNFATPLSSGEVIAALDADARVGPDYVESAIRAWERDPAAAGLQTQKRPVNSEASWLTRAQLEELLLDMSSQCGRLAAGGSGELRGNGMFIRRDVLDRVGGWGNDALTEDLDMSTRLVAAGERVAVAPEVAVGEQAVESVPPLWHQRMRWAEGSLRRSIAHAGGVIRGPAPVVTKLDALAFLITESVVPPFVAATFVAYAVRRPRGRSEDWRLPAAIAAGYTGAPALLAWSGLAADGTSGSRLLAGSLRAAFFLTHWLVVVPAALARLAFGPTRIRYVKTPRVAPLEQHGPPEG